MSHNSLIYNRVLVVDDSRSVLGVVCAHLKEIEGIEIETAGTFAQTEKILRENQDVPFLCAVLDLGLPDAPNGEVVDMVHKYDIPIIVLTGSIDNAVRQTMTAKLIVDYVVKRNMNEIAYVATQVEKLFNNQFSEVLVVDDSKTYRSFIGSLLRNLRYQVLFAKNGIEGLEQLKQNSEISLVITDYNMPKMDGLEFIEQVRRDHKREELAILGLSNASDHDLIVRLLKTGANDFMSKPVVADEFYCRVAQNVNMVGYMRQIKKHATSDYLTNVHNRRSLFDLGEVLYANTQRESIYLAVAMIDADHFKLINDTYGHDIGDKALVALAKTIQGVLRKSDIVARFGGEEFVCVAGIKKEDEAGMLFEKVRAAVEKIEILAGDKTIGVTVSIGVTTHLTASFSEMINVADSAVYQAKENGRNQVVVL